MVTGVEIRDTIDIPGIEITASYQRRGEPSMLEGYCQSSTFSPGDLISYYNTVFAVVEITGNMRTGEYLWTAEETNITTLPGFGPPDPLDVEVAVDSLMRVLKETDGEDSDSD